MAFKQEAWGPQSGRGWALLVEVVFIIVARVLAHESIFVLPPALHSLFGKFFFCVLSIYMYDFSLLAWFILPFLCYLLYEDSCLLVTWAFL